MTHTTQYDLISRNKSRSWLVVAIFIAFITLLAYTGYLAQVTSLELIIVCFAATLIWSFISYWWSSSIILTYSRAHEANKQEYFDFYTVTENLCFGSNLPLPKLYVMDDPSPNAFATGRDPQHSVVCVTTGLLAKLDRPELEAVIAHELSHIRHFDIRLASLIAVLAGAALMAIEIIIRSNLRSGRSRKDNKSSGAFIIIFYLLAIIAPILLDLLQLALSRQREYLADAGSVAMTRNPAAMIRALEKISADPQPVAHVSAAISEMYFADPFKKKDFLQSLSHLFTTHPPIEKRIAALRTITS